MERREFFATTSRGVEPVTAADLVSLGAADVREDVGGVHFSGDLRTLYRAHLELRTVTRITQKLREFAAITPEMLYSQTRRVRWESLLDPTRTFAVHATIQGTGGRSKTVQPGIAQAPRSRPGRKSAPVGITHSHYAALKIKDAIVDRLRREQGDRPNVNPKDPDIRVEAYFADGRCTLSLDASGASLHERGYRTETAGAPLKETLAASIVKLTGWQGDRPFIDPMCGSGTLAIEAALIARRIAPGLLRQSFGFERWPDFDRPLWDELVAEARAAILPKSPVPISGGDIDKRAIIAARANAKRAGVADDVRFDVADARQARPFGNDVGVIVVNPPYGERLGRNDELVDLYRAFGERLKHKFAGWSAYMLAGNLSLTRSIDLVASNKWKLYNGPLECRLLQFDVPGAE